MGFVSEGMLLTADTADGKRVLVTLDGEAKNGSRLT